MPSVAKNPDTVDIEHDFKIPPMCRIKLRNVRYMSEFITNHPLAPDLISIGEEAIAKENDDLLRQYFAEDYVFHGPGANVISRRCALTSPLCATHSVIFVLRAR